MPDAVRAHGDSLGETWRIERGTAGVGRGRGGESNLDVWGADDDGVVLEGVSVHPHLPPRPRLPHNKDRRQPPEEEEAEEEEGRRKRRAQSPS
eukprot:2501084-Rhodomonas_salina.4